MAQMKGPNGPGTMPERVSTVDAMGNKWGRHSKGRPDAPPSSGDDTSVIAEHSWWLDDVETTSTINRRWRSPRPDGLHPRRRATDQVLTPVPTTVEAADQAEPFDPDALYEQMSPADPVAETTGSIGASDTWTSLGLSSEATWSEVVARQRELAKEHHPDRHARDQVAARRAAHRMAEINAAVTELGKIYRETGER